ncbi:MAG: hypothetical protein NWR76_00735 [Opitutales bacterium]|jgi:hypothetical protein|nr:hypothetical protein [Opitutales bacterium]MDP4776449.1 hypothetical protein [Opitutales bacterium]MDP5079224.1 hypothetical protein [Opitutales bacterium]
MSAFTYVIMSLLNLQFFMLIVKIVFCVLPGVFGIFLLASSEENKRGMRNSFCNSLFGISNAIAFPKFARVLTIVGIIAIVYSVGTTWFFLLRDFF